MLEGIKVAIECENIINHRERSKDSDGNIHEITTRYHSQYINFFSLMSKITRACAVEVK